MLTPHRQNVCRSRLPDPGAIGHIVGLASIDSRRRYMVSHYPLTDSPDYHYSLGIHTVFVRFLDNGEIWRCSGSWFHAE